MHKSLTNIQTINSFTTSYRTIKCLNYETTRINFFFNVHQRLRCNLLICLYVITFVTDYFPATRTLPHSPKCSYSNSNLLTSHSVAN